MFAFVATFVIGEESERSNSNDKLNEMISLEPDGPMIA